MTSATKSQVYNNDIEDLYLDEFDDEDKINYQNYLLQSKILFPNLDPYIVQLAIIAHINKTKNRGKPLDKEEAMNLREKYLSNIKNVYTTPLKEDKKEDENIIINNVLY